MNIPYNAIYRNCTYGSAPPNKRAARAVDKKYFKILLNCWSKFNNFTKIVPHIMPSTKITQMVREGSGSVVECLT